MLKLHRVLDTETHFGKTETKTTLRKRLMKMKGLQESFTVKIKYNRGSHKH